MIHNIAHRGASTHEPENTLRALDRAISMGATMLEVDVRLSSDGHPVIIHDDDLSRTTNGSGRVRDLTLEQIKRFDAGRGEKVPTLAEVVDLARGRVELYLELKGQLTPAPTVKTLHTAGLADQAIVNSFHSCLLQEVKSIDPVVRSSMLVRRADRSADYIERALAIKADYVHLCWEDGSPTPHMLLDPVMIARIRQRGLGIILWHEERPAELRELVKFDVDGICTNRPDLLDTILKEQKGIL